MKKYLAVLMTVLFLGSTVGLVMAQDASSTPVVAKTMVKKDSKTKGKHKSASKHKKSTSKHKKSSKHSHSKKAKAVTTPTV
ncbi:MAG: hypothetical protein ACREL1_07490 [bacterium]